MGREQFILLFESSVWDAVTYFNFRDLVISVRRRRSRYKIVFPFCRITCIKVQKQDNWKAFGRRVLAQTASNQN